MRWGFSYPSGATSSWLRGLPECLGEDFAINPPRHEILCAVEHSSAISIFASSFIVVIVRLRGIEHFFAICVLSALSLIAPSTWE